MPRTLLVAVFILGLFSPAYAQAPYDDPWSPAGWAWSKIRNGEIADFNTRDGCNGQLDPRVKPGWDAPCRQIPPQFLLDILTVPKWRDEILRHRVRLGGAHINGTIDLGDAEITPEVELVGSRIDGNVNLVGSRWKRRLSLRHSMVFGEFSAVRLSSESDISLGHAEVEGDVDLGSAQVSGGLFMDHATFDGTVDLNGANIGGDLMMDGSAFEGVVNASQVSVERSLLMRNATFDGELNLIGTKTGGSLEMKGSAFSGTIQASPINVGGGLFMDDGALFGGEVSLVGARIAGNLYLSGSTAWKINLSDAEMREFLLAGLGWWCAAGEPPVGPGVELSPAHWPLGDDSWRNAHCGGPEPVSPPMLLLRNTHVDEFQDSLDAWPPSLDLEGFRYNHLGGQIGVSKDDVRRRSVAEWTDWLARDPTYGGQPYEQLSSALAAAGQSYAAASVQFEGRDRERKEACANWNSPRGCAWLSFLRYADGYGIGLYTFRVLIPVVGFTAFGAVVLWFSQNARRQHSKLWLIGASLHRLLPIVELNKDFTRFFENPTTDEPRNLNSFQEAYFALHAMAGWALGLILLAAVSGMIQQR